MEISKINLLKEAFSAKLTPHYTFESKFLQDALSNFKKNWSLSTDDLGEMWHQALHSNISRHHWQSQSRKPKEWIAHFFKLDHDFTKSMFYELYNESFPLSTRLERFHYYSDEMMRVYRTKNPMSIDNLHHQDNEAMMLYLTLMYPDKYTLYNFEAFQYFIKFVKAKHPLEIDDMDRYQKICKLVYNIISKDKTFMDKFERCYGHPSSSNKYAVVYELFLFGITSSS